MAKYHAKTHHVSFNTYRANSEEYAYYIGAERIKQTSTVRDLGIIFDEHLTFVPHVDSLVSKMRSLYGAAYRFSNDIKNASIVLKKVNTYITPVLEYCSVVWNQDRKGSNQRIERILHLATRTALHSPYDHRDENYISFEKRINLHQLTYEDRRTITSIIDTVKILNGDINSALTNVLINAKYVSAHNTRRPNIFDPSQIKAAKISLLYMGIQRHHFRKHQDRYDQKIAKRTSTKFETNIIFF